MRRSTVVRKSEPEPLTNAELQRVAQKLAVALENNSEDIALLTLLFDHLEQVHCETSELSVAIYTIKKHLFIDTDAASQAQEAFEADAYANKGKLLRWPSERRSAS